jgi:hypothetical protein
MVLLSWCWPSLTKVPLSAVRLLQSTTNVSSPTIWGATVDRQCVVTGHQGATIDHQGATTDYQGVIIGHQGAKKGSLYEMC